MEVVATTGAIACAKLEPNCHNQQTNTQLFTGRVPFLLPNQQCQTAYTVHEYDYTAVQADGSVYLLWTCQHADRFGSDSSGTSCEFEG